MSINEEVIYEDVVIRIFFESEIEYTYIGMIASVYERSVFDFGSRLCPKTRH